jgi:ABC-type multidrug transport system fused ATPase/permease subunit
VRLGRPEATDAQVAEALAAAGIPVDDPALPAGLATRVGEGSSGLSVGQRRRVALARALLRDAPLVLLDEPTAALDADTEMLVVEAVRLLREAGRTVVVVAHRPALVALADDVVDIAAAQRRQGDAAAQRRQGDAAAQRRVGRDDADVPPAEVGA